MSAGTGDKHSDSLSIKGPHVKGQGRVGQPHVLCQQWVLGAALAPALWMASGLLTEAPPQCLHDLEEPLSLSLSLCILAFPLLEPQTELIWMLCGDV